MQAECWRLSSWWTASPANLHGSSNASGMKIRRSRTAQRMRWNASPARGLRGLLPEAKPRKLRWNLALLIPRLKLTVPECRRAAGVLRSYLDDKSSIVKTAALHGLADLTRQDRALLPEVIELLRVSGRSGTPTMRARSRILLKEFEREAGKPRAFPGSTR